MVSMTDTTASEDRQDVFIVRNWGGFLTKWAEIAKRAERTGCTIGYEVLADQIIQVRNCENPCCDGTSPLHGTHGERTVTVRAWGETPKFAGYELIAVIEDLHEPMRQVRGVPGHEAELTDDLWMTDDHCDHCSANRRRHSVIVLRHESGQVVQVGTSCVKDFLGGHSPETVAWMAGWLPELREGNDEDYGSYIIERAEDPKHFLALVVASIDMHGWVSRGQVSDYER